MAKKLYERAALIRAVRFFFEQQGYLEVETPVRNPVLIPEANIDPVSSEDFFLQTSPELCMKRLLAQGYEKIFQLCKCFRSRERGARHLPEFTMLEWYRTGAEYRSLMTETHQLLCFIAEKVEGVAGFDQDTVHLLRQEPEYITVAKAFTDYAEMSVDQALRRDCFDEILVEQIEPNLGLTKPCFLYDYPVALGSLARRKSEDEDVAERFELYLCGVELANGFSELTDAREQRLRFEVELEASEGQRQAMPERFLQDLQQMPEACGIALGVDRLVMLLVGEAEVDHVVSFTPEEL